MNNKEFSEEFDMLFINSTNTQSVGFDSYEKSIFLTLALDDLCKSYFDPMYNKLQLGYDDSPIRQIDFSNITVVENLKPYIVNESLATNHLARVLESDTVIGEDTSTIQTKIPLIDSRSKLIKFPESGKILSILNESIITNDKKSLVVIPLKFTRYSELMARPYKRPLKGLAWRLLNSNKNTRYAEVILGNGLEIKSYIIRYVRVPKPIVLVDEFDENYDTEISPCELDPIIHKDIVKRAVETARSVWQGDINSQLVLGTTSSTNLGVIPTTK